MSPTSGSPVKRAFSGARTNPQFRVNNAKLAENYRDLGVKLQEMQLKWRLWRVPCAFGAHRAQVSPFAIQIVRMVLWNSL